MKNYWIQFLAKYAKIITVSHHQSIRHRVISLIFTAATLLVSRTKLLLRRETIASFALKQRREKKIKKLIYLFYRERELLGFWYKELMARSFGFFVSGWCTSSHFQNITVSPVIKQILHVFMQTFCELVYLWTLKIMCTCGRSKYVYMLKLSK